MWGIGTSQVFYLHRTICEMYTKRVTIVVCLVGYCFYVLSISPEYVIWNKQRFVSV